VWDEIRRDLWPHLQLEDELVLSWGETRHALSRSLLETLRKERQETHELLAALTASSETARETVLGRAAFARTLLALSRKLDRHVERYDNEVLPAILRALSHR
jgi:hypothetical protein